jgi:hypothetical protein
VWSDTFSKIKQELENLNRLLDSARPLVQKVRKQDPEYVELMALAGILHSFYMGFENIFKRIVMEIDGGFKKSDSWHIDLLENMVEPTNKRPEVLTEATKGKLRLYLVFRHVFRSNYSYDLNWSKIKNLVLESETILRLVEKEIEIFIARAGKKVL